MIATVRGWLQREERKTWLRIPRDEEAEHIQLLGDSGTGKSQIIHSFLRQIARREPAEAAVIYDPACEFVKHHFNAERGDIVLNPLDARCPFWSPISEVRYATDRNLIAESFFPGRADKRDSVGQFFIKAARSIFARMLEFNPTPPQMMAWLQDAKCIDERVAGTEHVHYIDPNAGNQRGGVLGSLAEVGGTLKLLPPEDECQNAVVLTEWAAKRRGWIFITSTKDTRDSLRPLQAVFFDVLMKRLMSVEPEWGRLHPCWLVVDEVHSLKRLPALHDALAEGRKYGIKIVQGTQGRSQYEEYYGQLAKAMLAAPHLKILMRCNEPEGAKWIADLIGEVETEKLKIGTTAAVQDQGRDSINYSTLTERRSVISKEEIMALPNLQGFWKYGDKVVGFRLPYHPMPHIAHGFLPRAPQQEETPPTIAEKAPESASKKEHQPKRREGSVSPDEARQLVLKKLQERKDTPRSTPSEVGTSQHADEAPAGVAQEAAAPLEPAPKSIESVQPENPPSPSPLSAQDEPPAKVDQNVPPELPLERVPPTSQNGIGMSF